MAKNEKRGLGTGLGALFGEDVYEQENQTSDLMLPIDKVSPRATQPRVYFSDESLNTLSESIKLYGIITPITVRSMQDGFYEIIAGERRWRAARLAGLKEVPVRIIEADDRLASELALVENLQREDLNPIEEAKGYKSLIEEYGMTQDEVAKRIGRSRPAITNAIRLLSLSSEISELVEKGQLSAGHARALLPVKDVKKQQELANAIINKGYSVRHAEKMAAETLKPAKEKETESKSVSPDYAKYVSDALSDILGRKVVLYDGKKTGKIELTFYGPDDREALIEELKKIGKL